MEQDPFATQEFEPIFVARQPIFDRVQSIWGYELLFRSQAAQRVAEVQSQDTATARVIADGVSLARVDKGLRVLVNFPRDLLLEGAPRALPKECCVVEVLEHVLPEPPVLAVLQELREAGYMLALDDYAGQPELEPFLDLVHLVKVEFQGLTPTNALRITSALQARPVELLAEKIEDERGYQLAWVLGYRFFQGYWFRKPETLSGRKISVGAMAKFRLLRELSKTDYEVATLGKIIATDSSLSYRLLKYVNSVSFSLRAKITSLKQAVAFLGSQTLKQWLMAVVIADVAPSPRAQELAYYCVLRGRFLELCAHSSRKTPRDPDTMFLVGLFSQLDLLLGQEMSELLAEMPLDDGVKEALQGGENEIRQWLSLCEAAEQGEWDLMERLVAQLGLDGPRTARLHARSTAWAGDILGLCVTMKNRPPQ